MHLMKKETSHHNLLALEQHSHLDVHFVTLCALSAVLREPPAARGGSISLFIARAGLPAKSSLKT